MVVSNGCVLNGTSVAFYRKHDNPERQNATCNFF